MRRPLLSAATCVAAACIAAAALAAIPDLRLAVGRAAQGDITFAGEEDRVAVDLLAGQKLTFAAKPSRKSLLHPAVDVFDGAGAAQAVPAAQHVTKPKLAAVNAWLVPATGTYHLGIRAADGASTGLYDLTTRARPAPPTKFPAGSFDAANEVDELAFDAFAGSKITLTLKRTKGSTAIPRVLSVIAPDTASVPLTGATRRSLDASDVIRNLTLPQFGRYRVRVQGSAGTTGGYALTLALKAPAPAKGKLDFRGASGGEDAAGPITSIEIAPRTTTLLSTGKTAQLLAKATYADGRMRDATRAVTWASRTPSVATVANGATPGVATAKVAGGAVVQAWAGEVEAREALVLVGGAMVSGVTIAPPAPVVAAGDSIVLQATATISTGAPVDVTGAADWIASGAVPATVAGSRVTVGGTTGTAQITASVNGATSAARDLTVVARRLERIVVAPAYKETSGAAQAFTATATYSDGSTADVTSSASWASDNDAAATMSGATATFVAPGTAGIRATLDGVTSRGAVLNCGPVPLSTIVVSGGAVIPIGAVRALAADAVFADGGTRDVTEAATWSSDAPDVVSVQTTPGLRGRATRIVGGGPAVISASVTTATGLRKGTASSSADAAERVRVFIVPRTATVELSALVQLRAFAAKSDGTFEDVTDAATWTSSNADAAPVAGGLVRGAANGGAAIAALVSGKTAHAVVLAGVGSLTSVDVANPGGIPVGGSRPAFARAVFTPTTGAGPDPAADVSDLVSWFSSDPVAAPVDAAGLVARRRAQPNDVSAALHGLASPATPVDPVVGVVEVSLRVFPQAVRAVVAADVQLAAQVTSSDGSVADRAAASTWNSESTDKATVDATGLAHAVARGTSLITATRPGAGGVSGSTTFSTALEPPAITSVTSAPLVRGTSGVVVTIDGAGLDGPNPVVAFSGTGVSAGGPPVANADGTQATVSVNVSGGAAPGPRDLTFTTSLGAATSVDAVLVANTPPTISSVSPTNIDVPATGSTAATITVTGTGYATGDALSLGTLLGVSLSNVQIVNSTKMTGLVTVLAGTTKTRIDVVVTQSAGAGGAVATLTEGLKIGPPDPTVTSFAPSYAQRFVHTVTGQVVGTNFGAGIVLTFPNTSATIANLSYQRQTPTLITFQFDVIGSAATGVFDLVLQNVNDAPRTFAGLLVVAPSDPTVTSFSAASLSRGATNVPVEIAGTNFLSGDGVAASGSGVSFSNVVVVSSERITAGASVAAGAALSARSVIVSHATSLGGRSGVLPNAFRVADAGPTVTSCTPAVVGRTGAGGPTRRVPVTVTGANFCVGAVVSLSAAGGSGLTVVASGTTVVSDTKLVINVDVAGAATVGAWDVVVVNPAGLGVSGSSGNGKFAVASETTLTVNRVVASSGGALGGERVTVYGSGFLRGLTVDFGTERAAGAQYIDQNTAVCTVPPPADPSAPTSTSNSRTAATFVDVKVTNPGAANATLTGGYSYLANGTAFHIAQSYPADGATSIPQNLKSAVVRLTDYANTSTAVQGATRGAQCQWYEAGGYSLASQTVSFGADRRFLVFSHPVGGNLPFGQNGTTTPGRYVLETATAVKSAAGAPLVPAKLAQSLNYDQWYFTISNAVTDITSPTVTASVPGLSATGVSTNTVVSLSFSKEMDPRTVTTTSITVTPSGGSPVACAVSMSNDLKIVTLTPYAELAAGTTYTVNTGGLADLFGNPPTISPRVFTTGAGADTTAPTIDSVVFEQIPANQDGSTTYVAGTDTPATITNAAQLFRLYLPMSGWKVTVSYSDTGGAGVDESQFSAKANVASGSSSAGAELASKFTVTSTAATWTVASADALASGDAATLTFTIKDKAATANTSTSKVVTVNLIDIAATAVNGGNLDPFDARETWLLRFDRDVYTAALSTTGTPPAATQLVTTTAAANGVLDLEDGMRISGLATSNMTTDAANTVNGTSVGTNAIVVRLVEERIRATLRARFGIGEDGSRGADSADIEFLLAGEQGSLASMPVWSGSSSASTGYAYSEMDIGGDVGVPIGSLAGTIGFAYVDPRNRNHEADMNDGLAAGSNNGIFGINMARAVMNLTVTGTTWGAKVLKNFQAAKGGTPIGQHALDDDVLAGSYDRTSTDASNTQAMKDRYDQIMDAVEMSALSVSSVAAHEMAHSMGLVPNAGPKTGFFGNAHYTNTFTEATTALPNTSNHLNSLGNDIMSPASSVDQRTATGTDFMKFAPYERNYFLRRQVHDEGR